ncbi:MAG: leucine-rich repeat domain-containing protein, partial [Verrucomicrobiaceae bacterium]
MDNFQPSALNGCWTLQNIHVTGAGTKYNSVGGVMFKGTSNTHLVRFPEGRTGTYVMPSSVVRVGSGAFGGSRLNKVGFSAKLTSLDSGAFSGSRLKSITLPASLETIADRAFAGSDLTTVHIPAGVKTIGEEAFSWCHDLASFTVATGNTAFSGLDGCLYDKSGKVFLRCPHGKKDVLIRPGTTVIGPAAFRAHPDLKRVSIP